MNINLQQRHNKEQCLNNYHNVFPDCVIEKFMAIFTFFSHVEHVFKANARHL
jgi:hypothetical protein